MIGDPATVMVLTDSAKATSGFDLGFEKALASDLDWLRWRPLFEWQSWILWVHDCECRRVCTYIELSVISVLVEGYNSTPILNVRNEPNNIYSWFNEQNNKERAENWTLRDASEWGDGLNRLGSIVCSGSIVVCSGSIVVTTLDSGPGGSWFESRVGANILWGSIDCTGLTRAFIPSG